MFKVYYQGKLAEFETFCDAYTFTLLLKSDSIHYSFIMGGK